MTASAGSHSYDNDLLGRRTFRDWGSQTTAVKYTWDVLDRMTALQQKTKGATYRYRADGMRAQKVQGIHLQVRLDDQQQVSGYDDAWDSNKPTTRYFYDGQMPVSEIHMEPVGNSTSFEYTSYVPGPRGLESTTVGTISFTTTYPLYDCHGNNVANLKKGSSVDTWDSNLNERSYDAWGTVTGSSPAPYQRYCASLGHRQDDESASGSSSGDGLVYMRARYYEPATGRFVSEDPAFDGLNWYLYAGNDPTNCSDPTGTRRTVQIGPFTFNLDGSGSGNHGWDLEILDPQGNKIFHRWGDGLEKDGCMLKISERVVEAIRQVLSSGNQSKIAFLRGLMDKGGFGMWRALRNAFRDILGMVFLSYAYTSVDAYAQQEPEDFADTIRTIGSWGRR
ncbi:MAG: RHS repeat-associated core domain-containing protein [Armatimonadetes bacterium]|nr:RHS repeat-associated core domain-containing protein [Armatimonadota bacterium]